MAIYNPAGLYSGGAFRIDTTPMYNFMLKKQAQEQAREDALTKYYQNLTDKATDVGMRGTEKEVFDKAVQNYKNFAIQNAGLLSKGDAATRMKAEELAKIPFQIASESRNAFNIDNKVGTAAMANPNMKKRWTKATWDAYNKSVSPTHIQDANGNIVRNPEYVPFNTATIETIPDKVDLPKLWSQIPKDLEVKETETVLTPLPGSNKFEKIQRTQKSVGAADLKRVGDYAKVKYDDDAIEYNFKEYLKDMTPTQLKEADAVKYNELNDAYKSVYGNDIESDKEPEKALFTAYAISGSNKARIETKPVRDEIAWEEYKSAKDFENQKKLAQYKESIKKNRPDVDVDNVRTSFEDIPDGTYGAYTKKGNLWYDASGKLATSSGGKFDIEIPGGMIPSGLLEHIPPSQRPAIEKIRINVKDGVAQGAVDNDPDGLYKMLPRTQAAEKSYKGTGVKVPIKTMQSGESQKKEDRLKINI